MSTLITKCKIVVCAGLIIFTLGITAPNTTHAGGGGGGVVQLATTLIGILVFANNFLPGKEFTMGDNAVTAAEIVALNFYLGNIWYKPSVNSVWQITSYTIQLRVFMALIRYWQTYRYLVVRNEIEKSLYPYGVVNHPNAINNLATVELLTQYDLKTGGEVRRKLQEYKQMQSIMALLNLVFLYNPYSSYFIFQRGGLVDIDLNYKPSYLSPVQVITIAYLSNLIGTYVSLIMGTTSDTNIDQRTTLSAGIAIAILSYVLLNAAVLAEY